MKAKPHMHGWEEPPLPSARSVSLGRGRRLHIALMLLVTLSTGCHMLLGFGDDEDEPAASSSTNAGGAASSASEGGGGPGAGGGGNGGGPGTWATLAVGEQDFSPSPPLGPINDSFSTASATQSNWGARFFERNEGDYVGDVPCSASLQPGELRLRAGVPGINQGYFWDSGGNVHNQSGPVIYQPIRGDFAVEVDLEVVPTGPMPEYSGAGIIVRNPDVANHFVYYNLSLRGSSELSTQARLRNPNGGAGQGDAYTTYEPTSVTSRRGRLVICRIGGSFSFYRRFPEDDGPVHDDDTSVNGLGLASVDLLEVGLSAHWYLNAGAPLEGLFRAVEFHPAVESTQACGAILE